MPESLGLSQGLAEQTLGGREQNLFLDANVLQKTVAEFVVGREFIVGRASGGSGEQRIEATVIVSEEPADSADRIFL
ncbi:MAG: hypothetical protein WA005_10040 [Candidatus Binataceae bacterium]